MINISIFIFFIFFHFWSRNFLENFSLIKFTQIFCVIYNITYLLILTRTEFDIDNVPIFVFHHIARKVKHFGKNEKKGFQIILLFSLKFSQSINCKILIFDPMKQIEEKKIIHMKLWTLIGHYD